MSSQASTMPSLLIQDVEHGTGTTKSAFHALSDGLSMPTRFAFQYLTNAKHMMKLEIA